MPNKVNRFDMNVQKGNVLSRLEWLEEFARHVQTRGINLDITNVEMGMTEIIMPAVSGTTADPTDPAFTGVIISPNGQMVDGVLYNFALVENGVVVSGWGDDGGVIVVGGTGDVISDSSSSTVMNIPLFNSTDGKHIAEYGLSFEALSPYGTFYYLSETASDIAGYKTLVKSYGAIASGTTTAALTVGGGMTLIDEFISDTWNAPIFLQGINVAGLFFSSNVDQNIAFECRLYKRTAGGVETSLMGAFAKSAQVVTGTPVLLNGGNIASTALLNTTDRIVLKVYAGVASDANVTLTFGSATCPSYCAVPFGSDSNSADVIGDTVPSVADHATTYTDTTGKHIKDSGLFLFGDSANDIVSLGESAASSNTGDNVVAIGLNAAASNTGGNVVAIGEATAQNNVGEKVFAIGEGAAFDNTGGDIIAIGEAAASSNAGSNVVAIGQDAARNNTGDNLIAIGAYAGKYETANNKLFIDTLDRINEAGGQAGAIIYGVMNADPTLQALTVNGSLDISEGIEFTPAVAADWTGSADPGQVNDALDQLAARLTDEEAKAETDPVFSASEAASFAAGDAAKLAGIEAGADVTDATNVAAAGAIMASLLTERGSIIFRDASAPAELLHGNAGQVFTSGGNGADPSWQDASSGVTHPQIMTRISIGF